jgi:hypothetical protein
MASKPYVFLVSALTIAAALPIAGRAEIATYVGYDASSPTGNFGSPSATNNSIGYTISFGSDSSGIHGTFTTDFPLAGLSPTGPFANLYFGTGATYNLGSTLGIEVTNHRAFKPGGTCCFELNGTGFTYSDTAATGSTGEMISFFLPWTYLTTDPDGVGFDKLTATDPNVELRLSQTYSYSVAGGSANFGPNRFGVVTDDALTATPEPAMWPVLGLGLAAVAMFHKRRTLNA